MQNLQKEGEKTKVEKEGGLFARQSGENHRPWWENTGGASVKQFRKNLNHYLNIFQKWSSGKLTQLSHFLTIYILWCINFKICDEF